jgi:hypothetical protein
MRAMSQAPEESQDFLFVYFQNDSGPFWIYDGNYYHRFLWNTEGVRFIRSQSYLPKYTIGKCIYINNDQRQALSYEAALYNLQVTFFDSEHECNDYYASVHRDQLIFDQTVPGGFFYLDNGMKRPKENGVES